MVIAGSVGQVFDLAIRSERIAGEFYERLADLFSFYPEIKQFWLDKAHEECDHIHWIEKIRARQNQEKLNQLVDPYVLEQAIQSSSVMIGSIIARIKTLQDAYQEASKIEQAETNAVFEFLIETCADDPEVKNFLRDHLHQHVGSLMLEFPSHYGTGTLRRGIMARHN